MFSFRPRHLGCYHKIGEVLTCHGFGAIVAELGLAGTPDLPMRLLRRELALESRGSAAAHLRQALEELGPTFIKVGQIASTRPEILSPVYINELSNLQDNVPPAPWEQVQVIPEEELGLPLEEVFLALDSAPIASTSLASVYAAMLPDRTQVVVKV
jgi:ubiquinone biosynthesis protein